jgi:hypothetical protein
VDHVKVIIKNKRLELYKNKKVIIKYNKLGLYKKRRVRVIKLRMVRVRELKNSISYFLPRASAAAFGGFLFRKWPSSSCLRPKFPTPLLRPRTPQDSNATYLFLPAIKSSRRPAKLS